MGIKVMLLSVWGIAYASTLEHSGATFNPWVWALFGVVLYNYLIFNLTKDELDDSSKKFSFRNYAKVRWDNWVWSILLVPVIVVYGDQLWYYAMAYYEKDWKFYNVIYLTAGVLAEGLYYLLKKMFLIKKALGGNK